MSASEPPFNSRYREMWRDLNAIGRRFISEQEMDDWLDACAADPSIVTPHEMGYLPDGTRRFPDAR